MAKLIETTDKLITKKELEDFVARYPNVKVDANTSFGRLILQGFEIQENSVVIYGITQTSYVSPNSIQIHRNNPVYADVPFSDIIAVTVADIENGMSYVKVLYKREDKYMSTNI